MATYNSGSYTLTGLLFSAVTAETLASQTVTYGIIGLASTFNITGDAGSSTVINQTVSVLDQLNLYAAGGTITLGNGIAGVDNIAATISGGGSFVVGSTLLNALSNTAVAFGTGGGSLVLGAAGTYSALSLLNSSSIGGFTSSTAAIDDRSLNYAGISGYTVTGTGTQTVSITSSSGSLSLTLTGAKLATGTFNGASLRNGTLQFFADGSGGTLITVCFLAGTRIATPDGEQAVETLAAGSLVATCEDGKVRHRPVRWLGRGHVAAARHRDTGDHYPVRILADAFADGVPKRDLLVTQEHCIFVDGALIPARMLVNGGTAIVDREIAEFDYFHVELDQHAILLAEGLETESYLDTGNRGMFRNAAVADAIPRFCVNADDARWQTDAAAPLVVAREAVEPIWQRLADRAATLGRATQSWPLVLDDEPALQLVTADGRIIAPALSDGRIYGFVLPPDAGSVRLVSRAARPSDTMGPFIDDRRPLGVMVGAIGVGTGRNRTLLVSHLAGTALPGWHGEEPGRAARWTDGDALLPVDAAMAGETGLCLDLEVLATGPFPVVPFPVAPLANVA